MKWLRKQSVLRLKKAVFALALSAVLGLLCTAQAAITLSVKGVSQGAGFDAGFGVEAEYDQRWDWFGVDVSGNILSQKKHGADSGIKGGVEAQGRGFIGDFYFGVGGAWAGYDSAFDEGDWKKDAFWPVVEIGYETDLFDAWFSYYLPESQTENESESLKLGMAYVFKDHWRVSAELARVEYDQGGNREDDLTATIGIGWEF